MQEHAERNYSSEVDNEKRCIFNDRGHCRYGNHCYYKHVVEICELSEDCAETSCPKRHPQHCKFQSICSFGPNCSYRHVSEEVNIDRKKAEEKNIQEEETSCEKKCVVHSNTAGEVSREH